jgi:leucyl aminopeptidase (aminopeptidase T)
MDEPSQLVAPASSALRNVLDVTARDSVLVVTDAATARIGSAFAAAARDLGATAAIYDLPENDRPLTGVPPALTEAVRDRSVVVNAFRADVAEVPFRVQLCLLLEKRDDLRFGHAPGINEAMFREGPLGVDYTAMRALATRLLAAVDEAVCFRLTSADGSDARIAVQARAFWCDLRARPGKGVNLPCGEVYCAPVEVGADGVLVVDGTVSSLGLPPAPVRITLQRGRIVALECAESRFLGQVEALLAADDEARIIGELGIGVNPGARLVGNMLEDEKALGTCHVAFGNNEDMPGGRNRSSVHHDFLLRAPTLVVELTDGASREIIGAGRLRV